MSEANEDYGFRGKIRPGENYSRADKRWFARKLRREATPAERLLLAALRARYGAGALFQVCLQGYIADFLIGNTRVIVEVDGVHHLGDPEQAAYDRSRDGKLRRAGYVILRYPNARVLFDVDGVTREICALVELRRAERRAAKSIGRALLNLPSA